MWSMSWQRVIYAKSMHVQLSVWQYFLRQNPDGYLCWFSWRHNNQICCSQGQQYFFESPIFLEIFLLHFFFDPFKTTINWPKASLPLLFYSIRFQIDTEISSQVTPVARLWGYSCSIFTFYFSLHRRFLSYFSFPSKKFPHFLPSSLCAFFHISASHSHNDIWD